MKKSLFAVGIIGLTALVLGAQYGSMDVLGILKVNTIQKLTGGTAVYVEGVYVSGGQIGAPTDRPSAYINNLDVTGTVTGISGSGDVTGPSSSTSGHVATFDGTTGKVIQDSGLTLSGANTGDETTSSIKTKLGAATSSADGYLSSTDWSAFNGKQAAISASGILKGDGAGGVSAATSGMDYAAASHVHTGVYEAANANIQSHISSTSNPHSTTASQVGAVAASGDETVAGVKTFSSFPVTPSSAPTTDYQVANKKYVDDHSGGGSGGGGLSAAQAKTADYSVVAADANKLTYLGKSTAAAKIVTFTKMPARLGCPDM